MTRRPFRMTGLYYINRKELRAMRKELAKNYDPKDIEDRLYSKWLDKKYFHSEVDETNDYHGKPEHIKWQWNIRFRDSFIGVSLDDFYEYCDKLTAAGFNGGLVPEMLDGCSVISTDMIKGESLAAFMLYNQTTKTLEIIYTNDPKSITG